MNSKDLIDELHIIFKKSKVSEKKADTKEIFDTVIDVIKSNLVAGKTISIQEFGVFESKPRSCQSPQDNKTKMIRWVLYFRTSLSLKKKFNEKKS